MAYVVKLRARFRTDLTGREQQLPVLYTESGILISHLRYLASRPYKSESWRDRAVFSVILLIRYINANENVFSKTTELLNSFSLALVEGTINPSTLRDPSNLYWSPRRFDDARTILGHITVYTDWLSDQEGHDGKRANPFRAATSTEQRLNWCAYYHKKNKVFLNHLIIPNRSQHSLDYVRQIRTKQPSVYDIPSVKRFPESKILDLLDNGFIRADQPINAPSHKRADYKGRAITLLMHYGGLRKSEALHLYLSDVLHDRKRNEAVVRVFHPENGVSPDPRYKTRREYLLREFRLKPRTKYSKSERLHLGWKDPLLTDPKGYFQIHFFPPEKATEFLYVWRNYLLYQRKEPSDGGRHPYAFTNCFGLPESLKNFQRIHIAAVKRIGLNHSKAEGTTEHGHRHSYGFRLSRHGFNQIQIQKAMHHKSPDSCLVYIEPTDEELCDAINEKING